MELMVHNIFRHQLIILGNGFDLACGLKSEFCAFFTPRVNSICALAQEGSREWALSCSEAGYTAWDLILRFRKDLVNKGYNVNWSDVEAAISDVVEVPAPESVSSHDPFIPDEESITVKSILSYFDFLDRYVGVESPCQFCADFEEQAERNHEEINGEFKLAFKGRIPDGGIVEACKHLIDEGVCINPDCYDYLEIARDECPNKSSEIVAKYLECIYPEIQKWNTGVVRKALLSELHKLEEAFGDYLETELASNSNYDANALNLLKAILSFDENELMVERAETTILSFNYTTPSIPGNIILGLPQRINVHGSLGSVLIFGADGTNCSSDSNALRFSKTYRVLEQKESSLTGPIAYAPNSGGLGSKETVAIKVYGHSLAQADYSYFQSIFDIVDLYSGRVKLYFLYREFKPEAREELLLSVANLLNAYGTSMDNRNHGKNLMHKLLLEGRLVLQRID